MVRYRRISRMTEESYCLNCNEIIGFRINGYIEFDDRSQGRIEGPVTKLSEEELEDLR